MARSLTLTGSHLEISAKMVRRISDEMTLTDRLEVTVIRTVEAIKIAN